MPHQNRRGYRDNPIDFLNDAVQNQQNVTSANEQRVVHSNDFEYDLIVKFFSTLNSSVYKTSYKNVQSQNIVSADRFKIKPIRRSLVMHTRLPCCRL